METRHPNDEKAYTAKQRISLIREDLPKIEAMKLLEALEQIAAYPETFSNNVLTANLIASHLNEAKKISENPRFKHIMEKVDKYNKSMITNEYLNSHIVNQTDSRFLLIYAILSSDEEYKRNYTTIIKPFSLSVWPEDKPSCNQLDLRVNNTEVYLNDAKNFMAILDLVQKRIATDAEEQAYLDNFIKPVELAIISYRNAEGEAAKIEAYKKISEPLKNLTTEMRAHAVKLYPEMDNPQPAVKLR